MIGDEVAQPSGLIAQGLAHPDHFATRDQIVIPLSGGAINQLFHHRATGIIVQIVRGLRTGDGLLDPLALVMSWGRSRPFGSPKPLIPINDYYESQVREQESQILGGPTTLTAPRRPLAVGETKLEQNIGHRTSRD